MSPLCIFGHRWRCTLVPQTLAIWPRLDVSWETPARECERCGRVEVWQGGPSVDENETDGWAVVEEAST